MASLLLSYLQCVAPSTGAARPTSNNNSAGAATGPGRFDLLVARQKQTALATLGFLFSGQRFLCFTLELPWKQNQSFVSRVPAGVYGAQVRYEITDLWPQGGWRIQLRAVPGRDGIQLHLGNEPKNTTGCVIVGNVVRADGQSVEKSEEAYTALRNHFYGSANPVRTPNTSITVTLVDEFPTFYNLFIPSGPWLTETGTPFPLHTNNGTFQLQSLGKWRLMLFLTSSQSETTIDYLDFDVVGFDDGVLFTIRALSLRVFNGTNIVIDSDTVDDSRIKNNWHRIAGVGPYRGYAQ